jgi:hypothetical protein
VIATSDASDRYERFLSDRVKSSWSGGDLENYAAALPRLMNHFAGFVNAEVRTAHPSKSDEEIAQALFDEAFQTALSVERKRFEHGFEAREGWEFAVLKYRSWVNRAI